MSKTETAFDDLTYRVLFGCLGQARGPVLTVDNNDSLAAPSTWEGMGVAQN